MAKDERHMKTFALAGILLMGGFVTSCAAFPKVASANDVSISQFEMFRDALERVRANYVRPVKDSELIDGAIQGMVSNLDPHSSYMDAKTFDDMQISAKGRFGGIGIEVAEEDRLIKVISS